MGDLSHNLMGVLLKSENSQLAVDKGINFLKGYFSGREGKARIDKLFLKIIKNSMKVV